MKLNQVELNRAVRESRNGKERDRVLIVFNPLTFSFWREELSQLQRSDPAQKIEFLIDSRVLSGRIEAQNVEREPVGARKIYDIRADLQPGWAKAANA